MRSPDPLASNIPLDSWTTDDLDTIHDVHDHGSPPGRDMPVCQGTLLHEYLLAALAQRLRRSSRADTSVGTSTHTVPPHLFARRSSDPVLVVEILAVIDASAAVEPVLTAPHYWRIGLLPLTTIGYRQEADGRYTPVTPVTDRIAFAEPWEVDIPLDALIPRLEG